MNSDQEAKILLEKAKRELTLAKRNLIESFYPEAVFNAQRAAEKAIKAVIIITGREFTKDHDPSGLFGKILLKELSHQIPQHLLKDVTRLGRFMNALASLRSVAEYPREKNGQVLAPWEQIGLEDAEESVKNAEEILEWAQKFLEWWS